MKSAGIILIGLFVALHLVALSHAQTLPLGTVTDVHDVTCPGGYAAHECQEATVTCPNIDAIQVTWGQTGTGKNTVVFFSSSAGIQIDSSSYDDYYVSEGLSAIQVTWASAWEVAGTIPQANVLAASCRGATILNYLSTPVKGAFCAQADSAGSALVAYSMAWYGLAKKLTAVELLSGPVLSNIEQGCEEPDAPAVTVRPTDGSSYQNTPQYVGETIESVSNWTGQICQPNHEDTPPAVDTQWLAQSIVQTGSTLNFPNTSISGWVCNNGLNNSAAQGWLFYDALTSDYSLTGISSCSGSEGVSVGKTPQGVEGEAAIEADMLAKCKQ
jgi:hypothetical protein